MGGMRKWSILLTLTSAATAAVALTATPMVARAIRAEGTAAAVSVPTTTSAAPATQFPTSAPTVTATVTPTLTATPTPTPAQAQPLSASAQTTLVRQVESAVLGASKGADIGFEVFDRDLGTSGDVMASSNADTPIYTASVVKLLIAIDALHRAGWAPSTSTRNEITHMLEGSNDGDASDFWDRDGGNAIVTRMVGLIGLKHTLLPTVTGQWGMAKMSASDVVATYQFIAYDMPAASSTLIMNALYNAKKTADDGFPQYFGIPDGLPATATWWIKQGWMILNSAVVLNTTGVVGTDNRYIVVLLTSQSAYTTYAKGRNAVTAGITALAPSLTLTKS
jgi:hypothetical protein